MHVLIGSLWSLLALHFILLSRVFQRVSAQNSEICSCSPLIYNWRFDFSRTCSRNNVNIRVGENTGIRGAACDVIDPNVIGPSNVTDFQPVVVISYQIIELGLDLIPIKVDGQSNLRLFNESKISFSSITAAQENVTSGGMQATVVGLNAERQRIQLNWIVRYSNRCEILPYEQGDSLGWMVFLTNDPGTLPRPSTCFRESNEPSLFPSINPSTSPTVISSEPTTSSMFPSITPSMLPTVISSEPSSSIFPSVRPSRLPTRGPTAFPTRQRTLEPTLLPSVMPTIEMSMSYSYSYSFSYSYNLGGDQKKYQHTEFGRTAMEEEDEWC